MKKYTNKKCYIFSCFNSATIFFFLNIFFHQKQQQLPLYKSPPYDKLTVSYHNQCHAITEPTIFLSAPHPTPPQPISPHTTPPPSCGVASGDNEGAARK